MLRRAGCPTSLAPKGPAISGLCGFVSGGVVAGEGRGGRQEIVHVMATKVGQVALYGPCLTRHFSRQRAPKVAGALIAVGSNKVARRSTRARLLRCGRSHAAISTLQEEAVYVEGPSRSRSPIAVARLVTGLQRAGSLRPTVAVMRERRRFS